MIKLKTIIYTLVIAYAPLSIASIIPADYAVNASISYDEFNSQQLNSLQNDTIAIGSDSTTIMNTLVSGNNPIAATLADTLTFDTSFMNGQDNVDFESIYYNFEVTLENNSASSNAEFFFNLNYFQTVFVEAENVLFDDAFVDTSLSLYDDSFNEIFSSYVYADSISGPDLISGDHAFSFELAAGESLNFKGSLELSGYSYDNANFSQSTSGALSLTKIIVNSTSVPEPSTALLLLLPTLFLLRKKNS